MSNKEGKTDFPFKEVIASAELKIKLGFEVHQSWYCNNCASKNEEEVANVFLELGKCKACGKFTDIKSRGCNYTAVMKITKIKH